MTHVTYIISHIDKAVGFEWIVERLNREHIQLSFILLNLKDGYFENYLKEKNIPVYRIGYRGKKDALPVILKVARLLRTLKADIVHTHFYEASLIGILAGTLARVKKRISSRHYSTDNHIYYPHGVVWDKLVNRLSTHIIAVSEPVKNILTDLEHVSPDKVTVIHHGLDLPFFAHPDRQKVDALRTKYALGQSHPVIGVIARQIEWKGIQYIIPAFKRLLEQYPDARLMLANATGNYKGAIDALLTGIPERNIILIPFEKDISSLYHLFDVYVHTPIDPSIEAFGLTYIEALASGIPSVFTLSGVANFYIRDRHNALVVPFKNSDAIYEAVMEILRKPDLKETLRANGLADVNRFFTLDRMIRSFEEVYAL